MSAIKAMQPFYKPPQRIAGSYYRCENLATYKLAMTSSAIRQVVRKQQRY
jgi:hypothetical protein